MLKLYDSTCPQRDFGELERKAAFLTVADSVSIQGQCLVMDNTEKPTIYLVDDDKLIRDYVSHILVSCGYQTAAFDSASAFLEHYTETLHGCLLLDLDLPGTDGLELQQVLNRRDSAIPIIFLTGSGDVPQSVRAIKAGAIDFLQKPFRKDVLIQAVEVALVVNQELRDDQNKQIALLKRFDKLTEREREILGYMVSGDATLSNKEIARKAGISHRTVEQHRARIMEKTETRSIGELIKLSAAISASSDPRA